MTPMSKLQELEHKLHIDRCLARPVRPESAPWLDGWLSAWSKYTRRLVLADIPASMVPGMATLAVWEAISLELEEVLLRAPSRLADGSAAFTWEGEASDELGDPVSLRINAIQRVQEMRERLLDIQVRGHRLGIEDADALREDLEALSLIGSLGGEIIEQAISGITVLLERASLWRAYPSVISNRNRRPATGLSRTREAHRLPNGETLQA